MKKIYLTIFLSVFAFSIKAQNAELAKAYYNEAKIANEAGILEDALNFIGQAKKQLNNATNPDIAYLEATIRFKNDINLVKTKLLFEQFLRDSNEDDERRESIKSSLLEFENKFYTYENGNRIFLNYKIPEDQRINIIAGIKYEYDIIQDLFNKKGEKVARFTFVKIGDVPTFNLIHYIPKNNSVNYDLTNSSMQLLQQQQFLIEDNSLKCKIIFHKSTPIIEVTKRKFLEADYASNIKAFDGIIIPHEINESFLTPNLIEYIKLKMNLDESNQFGIYTVFEFPDKNLEYGNYFLSDDLQEIYRHKKGKKKYYKFNPSTFQWVKTKLK